nr:MAG: hypothetical protein DIU78_01985 [Pseudomonadota bacterium]
MVPKEGGGPLIGRIGVEPGARVSAEVVAASVPIGKLDSLPTMLRAAQGTASAAATASGTLDALEAEVMATITPLRIGSVVLPSSELGVRLEPIRRGSPSGKLTPCGQPVALPFDRAEYDRDPIDGIFRVNGTMFGGQVALEDLRVTRQRKKTASGTIHLRNLDLEPLFALRPDPSGAAPPRGRVSGSVDLQAFAPTNPLAARGTLTLTGLRLERSGYTVELLPGTAPIAFGNRSVSVATAALRVGLPHGQALTLDVAGRVTDLGASPALNAGLRLRRTPLATFAGLVPRLERANGTLSGNLDVSGPLDSPRYSGGFAVERGELALRGLDLPISDIALALRVDGRDVTLVKGSARLGDGTVALRGGARLRGFSVDDARVRVTVQRLSLPAGPGVRAVADAELLAAYRPESNGGRRALPRVTGNVLLRSFEYRRPVTITADLQSLVQRGKRTEFEVYDPSEDAVELDLAIRSERPLKIANELIEAELLLADEGLLLSGTNARYGLRGVVRLRPGGRIVLRRSEFEVTEGTVRFDDPTRIAPEVDVTAVTEYRRYSDVSGTSSPSAAAQSASSAHAATGGRWTIRLHAHGHPDDLRVDLTSDPALPQDDIFLLLTVGLTRAELDQAQSASVGESVALEALGTLTGADRAVKDVVPLIDEFRFGSTYSSRTGRTEPTITIGKRLTERVRGNVTTGLAESREIRSNIEWQLSPRVSVEGSYDNVNDISSSSLGNLGTDVRWRLEFE